MKVNQCKSETQFKLDDETTTTDQKVISEKFNDFFINIGPNLAAKIPAQTVTPEHYLGIQTPTSLLLEPVTATEFGDIIKSLKKCSPGHDEINKDVLDLSLPIIQTHLLYLVNQSLVQGIFPDELKVANITPVFKANDSSKFNNYRPISVLSILSKIFEKAMYNRLI